MVFDREKCRARRERMGLTRADFAARARVHAKTIYNAEHGYTQPRGYILERIAEGLGCSIEELLCDATPGGPDSHPEEPRGGGRPAPDASCLSPETGPKLRALLDLDDTASMYRDLGEIRESVASYERLLELAHGRDPEAQRRLVISASIGLGSGLTYLGELPRALACPERGLALAREGRARIAESLALRQVGVAHYLAGDLRRSEATLLESLSLSRALGDGLAEIRAHNALANTTRALADPAAAREHGERALAKAEQLGARREAAQAHIALVFGAVDLDDLALAQDHFERALMGMSALRDRRGEAQAFGAGAVVAHAQRDAPAAKERARQSLSLAREIGDRHLEGWALGARAAQRGRAGDDEGALGDFSTWRSIATQIGDLRGQAASSWFIGQIHATRGDPDRALAALALCVAYEESMRHPRAAKHRRELERVERRLRGVRTARKAVRSPRAGGTEPEPPARARS